RALPLAGRVVVRDQSRAGAIDLADDGCVAGDELHRRLSVRLYRQLLEPDGQAGIFSFGRRRRGTGWDDDRRLQVGCKIRWTLAIACGLSRQSNNSGCL